MPKERKPRLKTPGPRGPGGGSLSYPYTNYPYTPRNHHQMHGRPSSSSGKRLTCIFPSFGGWLQATPGDSTPNPSQVHPTQLSRPAHAQKPAAQHLISTTLNATKPATCSATTARPTKSAYRTNLCSSQKSTSFGLPSLSLVASPVVSCPSHLRSSSAYFSPSWVTYDILTWLTCWMSTRYRSWTRS